MEGKTKKLLHTKPVVDFVSITDTPWESGKKFICCLCVKPLFCFDSN